MSRDFVHLCYDTNRVLLHVSGKTSLRYHETPSGAYCHLIFETNEERILDTHYIYIDDRDDSGLLRHVRRNVPRSDHYIVEGLF